MSESKKVIILGAGVGGMVAANLLRKKLPKNHRVILVDRKEEQFFGLSLLWVMIGERKRTQISKPLMKLNRRGIEFIRGEIEKIDVDQKSVTVSGNTIAGNALIVALGADFSAEKVSGLKEAGQSLYSLDGAERVYQQLSQFKSGKIVFLTAAPMYKCPAAPYEAAMLAEGFLRRCGLRSQAQIEFFAAEPGPMVTAGAEVTAGVRQMVEAKGIAYHPNHQVTSVDPLSKTIIFSNGASTNYDLLFYVPPHVAPGVVKDAGLVAENGWVSVNRQTLETQFKEVYAVGDVTLIPLSIGKPLPKAAIFAQGQAEVVANNLVHAWTGQGEKSNFSGIGQCYVEVGDGKAGVGGGNFFAEPTPKVSMQAPSRFGHYTKVILEKYMLWKWI